MKNVAKLWKWCVAHNNLIFRVCAYALLIFFIASTYIHFSTGAFHAPLWYCNMAVAVFAIICFQRSVSFLYFLLTTAAILQTPWILDWFFFWTTGHSVFGIDAIYSGVALYELVLTHIRHTMTVPLSIFLLSISRPQKLTLGHYGVFAGLIMGVLLLSRLGNAALNLNCAYASCAFALRPYLSGYVYFFVWFFLVLLIVLIVIRFVVAPLHKMFWFKVEKKSDEAR